MVYEWEHAAKKSASLINRNLGGNVVIVGVLVVNTESVEGAAIFNGEMDYFHAVEIADCLKDIRYDTSERYDWAVDNLNKKKQVN